MILNPLQAKKLEEKPWFSRVRYEFNRKTMFAVICPITSTIKNIPTRYTLPDDIETHRTSSDLTTEIFGLH